MTSVHASGVALFSGETSHVELERTGSGESTLRTSRGGGPISEWSPASAFRTSVIEHPSGARVTCVEHLFAALAAFAAHDGVSIFVQGAELPILDGGARAWSLLLHELHLPERAPRLVVAKQAQIVAGDAIYRFFPSEIDTQLTVNVDMSGCGAVADTLATQATWDGSRARFVSEIAPARTFVIARDLAEFTALGAATHVPPESVVVIAEDRLYSKGGACPPDEPVRHKLLDLIGDFFCWGGVPLGRVKAERPGHAKNHEAIDLALKNGILIPKVV